MIKQFTIRMLEKLGHRHSVFYKASIKLRDKGWKEFFYKTVVVFTRNLKTEVQTIPVTLEDIQKLKSLPLLCQHHDNDNQTVAFTIVSKNYMQYALVLRESYLKNNPDSEFYIILMDMFRNQEEMEIFRSLIEKGVNILSAVSVRNGMPYFYEEAMLLKYDILEMNTAIKPFFLEYFCNQGYEKIMYIDPDIYFTGSMNTLLNKLNKYDIILTPHAITPYPDAHNPDDLAILRAGAYNLGFIAIRNTSNSLRMCRWWEDKLFDLCKNNLPEGLFVDQKWMDLVPSMFENVYIEKSQAYNVAYWNLHERKVNKKNGIWLSEGNPLIFFHFSGMPIHNMEEISKHQTRYRLSDFPDMKELFEEYKSSVLKHGYDVFRQKCGEYYYGYLPATNVKIPDQIRYAYYKEILSEVSNPYLTSMENINGLLKSIYGMSDELSRFHKSIFMSRKDLQDFFGSNLEDKKVETDFKKWLKYAARKEYKAYHRIFDSSPVKQSEFCSPCGCHLVGYFKSVAGTAMVARSFCKILCSTGIPYTNTVLQNGENSSSVDEIGNIYDMYHTDVPLFKKMIYFINADSINGVKQYYPHFFKDTYNIAVWWWEFDDYFYFDEAFQYVDEVVVMSDFVYSAVSKAKPAHIKLTKVTYPFIPDWQILADRTAERCKLGIAENDYVFFFNFDYLSSFERKNPLGLLISFATFAKDKNNVKLVLKTVNCSTDSENKALTEKFVHENDLKDKIIFINETLSRNEMMTVLNAADCYISLHRSEGLGVGMMEAMYMGLPVIGTAYGGNTDFMTQENSYLVPYTLTKVKKDFGPYKAGWLWAEPDISVAVSMMNDVYTNRDLAHQKGENARITIKTKYSQRKVQKDIFDLMLK